MLLVHVIIGKIKHGHGGKAHLNRKKSGVRLARLGKKVNLLAVEHRLHGLINVVATAIN